MATLSHLATPDVTALAPTATGDAITLQNGSEDLCFIAVATAQPDPSDDATPRIVVPPYSHANGRLELPALAAGESVFVWSRNLGANCRLAWWKR